MNCFKMDVFIQEHSNRGIVLGLDNIIKVLDYFDNPQNDLKVIHIAGTNGKGSVGTFLASILANAGYKVGRFISPAVFQKNEIIQFGYIDSDCRFVVDYIEDKDLERYFCKIQEAEYELFDGNTQLTMFEAETVASFLAFKDNKCDVVLLEAGLGGRLDATNVVSNTLCEIITTISLDHTNVLGNTLEDITYEKCGIIKRNAIVVSAIQEESVSNVIKKCSSDMGITPIIIQKDNISNINMDINITKFDFEGHSYEINLIGKHQIINASVAIKVAKELMNVGFNIDSNAIKKGLTIDDWKGRMSIVSKQPLIIVDGAHNEDAALNLRDNIEHYFKDYKLIFVVGAFADKDTKKIMSIMAGLADVIYTFTTNNVRALDSEVLAKQASDYCNNVISANNIDNALDMAINNFNNIDSNNKAIICFGSLSFIKEIYNYCEVNN